MLVFCLLFLKIFILHYANLDLTLAHQLNQMLKLTHCLKIKYLIFLGFFKLTLQELFCHTRYCHIVEQIIYLLMLLILFTIYTSFT